MYTEHFLKSSSNLSELDKALSILQNINFFSVLLELSQTRCGSLPTENILESYAVQRGFSAGYFKCIDDIFNFNKNFVPLDLGDKKSPDYGAKKAMLEKGFTDEEIEYAREQSRNSGRGK